MCGWVYVYTPGRPTAVAKASHSAYKSKLFILDTWNVRTLLDEQNGTDRPRRRTALVASKLNKYNIDIAALSETRLAGEDSLIEVGQGYTFLWKGLPEDTRRHSRLSH